MRRNWSTHYQLAFLTVAVGIAAVPSTVGADGDPVVPVDDAASTPEQAAAAPVDEPPAPPTTDAPPKPETPDAPPTTEPPATTPEPEPTTPETTNPAPEPEPVPTTVADPPAPEPSAPSPKPPTAPNRPPQVVERPEPTPTPEADDGDDELDVEVGEPLPDVSVVRPIAFPVLGPVQYSNDWGNCRDGCARRHLGTDMIGVRMQPLLAAVDGTVTRVRYENVGTAGSVISITGADGWYYNYFHLNNDTPGTDDGAAGREWQVTPPLTVGSAVRAGQVIGYMGDSGNAEGSVPHLHFEIRQPDRTPVNPYHSLVAAQDRQTCEPTAPALHDAATLSDDAVAVIPLTGGGRWLIDRDGRLSAEGHAAHVDPASGVACARIQPVVEVAAPLVQAAHPPVAAVVPVAGTVAPDPAAATATSWTVERGQSLWEIAQTAYGVSDTAATVSLVNLVFDRNRNLIPDPDVIEIGMILQLPSVT